MKIHSTVKAILIVFPIMFENHMRTLVDIRVMTAMMGSYSEDMILYLSTGRASGHADYM